MTSEELLALIGNMPYCFWDGLPPCPKCKKDHGDPEATEEKDQERRAMLAELN